MDLEINIDIYKLAEKFNLTQSEELALNYIVNNFEKSLEIGVRGVAKQCFASTSVVMNLAKKLGYKGFVDMVYKLEFNMKGIQNDNKLNNFYCVNLTEEKVRYFKKLLSNKEKPFFIHGTGFSASVVKYISDKLIVLGYYGIRSGYLEIMDAQYNNTGIIIIISKSGETSQLFQFCNKAHSKSIPIILFTGANNSTIENLADLTFIIKDSNPIDDRILQYNDFFGNTILFFEYLLTLIK